MLKRSFGHCDLLPTIQVERVIICLYMNCKKMFDKDEIKLEIVDELPLTKIHYNAMDEGM